MFRKRPDAQVGDPIIFRMDRKAVAQATIRAIDKPGEIDSQPIEGRMRGKTWWKAHWTDFEDLREGEDEQGFVPNFYGGYAV